MKTLRRSVVPLLLVSLCAMALAVIPNYSKPPKLPKELTPTEQKFVGKWSGSRDQMRWEIHRKSDRSFEIVFEEPDYESPEIIYRNYGTGTWSVRGDHYFCEWKDWRGDEGDFSGEFSEKVSYVDESKIITLSDDSESQQNTELRVEHFILPGWGLKTN